MEQPKIVIGCNYHTKWQSNKSMRFVLVDVKDGKARLKTRRTGKDFWTSVNDLIFIDSRYNIQKAEIKIRRRMENNKKP
jgi:hypothetical protein